MEYVVRIVDGRIDAQGTPEKLRAEGQLQGLVAIEEAEVTQTEPISVKDEVDDEVKAVENGDESSGSDNGGGQNGAEKSKNKGPGKKFVQGEIATRASFTPHRRGASSWQCQVGHLQALHRSRHLHDLGLHNCDSR